MNSVFTPSAWALIKIFSITLENLSLNQRNVWALQIKDAVLILLHIGETSQYMYCSQTLVKGLQITIV